LSNKFKINEVDKCVYVKNTNNGYAIICLYMDNMFILYNNNYIIKSTKKILTNKFDMKNSGVADIIQGIKIYRIFDWYLIILRKFLTNFLK